MIVTIIGFGSKGLHYLSDLVAHYDNIEPLHINIVSPYNFFVTGTKYAPFNSNYLLNKKVKNYHSNYLKWLNDHYSDYHFNEESFTPRYLYGKYLLYRFEVIKQKMNIKGISYTVIYDLVDDIVKIINPNTASDTLISLTLTNSIIRTDKIVLNIGKNINNIINISSLKHNLINYGIFDIWSKIAFPLHQNIVPVCSYYNQNYLKSPTIIIIIGSGLSAIELINNLLENNFSGKIYCVSPNGSFNKPNQEYQIIDKLLTNKDITQSLCFMFSKINKFLKNNRQYDINDVINNIDFDLLWNSLSYKDKIRFNRHLKNKIDLYRNNININVYNRLNIAMQNKQLSLIKGIVYDINNIENYNVIYYSNNSNRGAIYGHIVINAIEPNNNLKDNTLIKHLTKHNLIDYNGLEYISLDERIIINNN